MLKSLKKDVCKANLKLVEFGLVTLTWGNVSGIDRKKNLVVIKPSGVPYDDMQPDHMVVVDLDGNVVEGDLNPSSDTPTHIILYKAFPEIGGIAHSHSTYATIFAQACTPVPCYGTTHADHFYGDVPVTRFLSEAEVERAYEKETGTVIVERFADIKPIEVPGVLVAGHAPFSWGKNAMDAVKNNLVLERCAHMALATKQVNPNAEPLPDYVLNKHYKRKHGPGAYYGQKK